MGSIESLIRLVEVLSPRHFVALGTAIRLDAPSIPGEVALVTSMYRETELHSAEQGKEVTKAQTKRVPAHRIGYCVGYR